MHTRTPLRKLVRAGLLGLATLGVGSISPAWAGNVFLSGHDPDFHSSQGPNTDGARHMMQIALDYARNGNNAPILFLKSDVSNLLLGDHADSELGLIASGYSAGSTPGNHYVKVGANEFGFISLAQFSAIFVPSDHGGTLTGNDLQALNARAADIANYVNMGGGLVALAEEGVRQPATTGGPQPQNYGFVPLNVTSAPLPWFDYPFTVTVLGAALGLQNSDINDYAAHSYFVTTAGMNVLDVDPSGRAMTLALQVVPVNHPPVAVASASPLFAILPGGDQFVLAADNVSAAVVLDGSQSSEADNDPLQFFWHIDGQSDLLATGAVATVVFAVGSHTVDLVVSDGHQTATSQVTFEVITPAQSIGIVMGLVNDSSLARTTKRPLVATLNAAAASFGRGDARPGINQLEAFQNKVRAQVAPFDPALAAELIGAVQALIGALGGN